jgi:fission process protein 1
VEKLIEENRNIVYVSRISRLLLTINKNLQVLRPLAYASEVGESFRPITSSYIVKFLYAISWGYVFLDTGIRVHKVNDKSYEIISLTFFDSLTWHVLASMVLPAFTIHAIVENSKKLFKKSNIQNIPLKKYTPTVIGLCSIPFIIHPLDHFTDYLMNNTIRQFYCNKLPKNLQH